MKKNNKKSSNKIIFAVIFSIIGIFLICCLTFVGFLLYLDGSNEFCRTDINSEIKIKISKGRLSSKEGYPMYYAKINISSQGWTELDISGVESSYYYQNSFPGYEITDAEGFCDFVREDIEIREIKSKNIMIVSDNISYNGGRKFYDTSDVITSIAKYSDDYAIEGYSTRPNIFGYRVEGDRLLAYGELTSIKKEEIPVEFEYVNGKWEYVS